MLKSLSKVGNCRISVMASTLKMAPAETIPTSPKESVSDAMEFFFIRETPAAIANTKGTVMAPVVAPEESNAIDMPSRTEKIEKLLWIVGFAEGPESASYPACHYYTIVVLHIELIIF